MAGTRFPESLWRLASEGDGAFEASPFGSTNGDTIRRRLNLYGFVRGEPPGTDASLAAADGETLYWHPNFRRSRPIVSRSKASVRNAPAVGRGVGPKLRAARDRLGRTLADAYTRYCDDQRRTLVDLRSSEVRQDESSPFADGYSADCSRYIDEQFNKYGSRLFRDEIEDVVKIESDRSYQVYFEL